MRPDPYSYIGGSKTAIILGASTRMTPVELWMEYIGKTESNFEFNEAMRWGLELEPWLRSRFQDKYDLIVEEIDFTHHPKYQFMGGHPDGILFDRIGREAGLFEGKTTARPRFAGGLPQDIYWQCQHYNFITGAEICYIFVAELHQQRFLNFTVEANEKDFNLMIEKCGEFWDCVKSKKPPEITKSSDIVLLNEEPKEGVLNGSKEHEEMLVRIEELKAMTGPLEDERKSLEENLKMTLGTSTRMDAGTYTVNWSPVKTSRFNSGLFKKQQPELFQQFITESSYRKFQIRRRSQNVES